MTDVYGVKVDDIVPDDYIPTEVVVVVKMLDDDGDYRMAHVYSDGVSTWEALGMARAMVLQLELELTQAMRDMGEDE